MYSRLPLIRLQLIRSQPKVPVGAHAFRWALTFIITILCWPLLDNSNLTSQHASAWLLTDPNSDWPLSRQHLSQQNLGVSECVEHVISCRKRLFLGCPSKIFKQQWQLTMSEYGIYPVLTLAPFSFKENLARNCFHGVRMLCCIATKLTLRNKPPLCNTY